MNMPFDERRIPRIDTYHLAQAHLKDVHAN